MYMRKRIFYEICKEIFEKRSIGNIRCSKGYLSYETKR